MKKIFGTDGIRGIANRELTPELSFQLGRCGGYILTKDTTTPKVVIGKDTRISSNMLENALIAGLLSIGVEVIRLGEISTPGVAYLTRNLQAQGGVMISASHNPVEDNGIKFFSEKGFKLSDEMEAEIETLLHEKEDQLPRPVGKEVGTVTVYLEGGQKYLQHLRSTVSHSFEGLKIVIDCANGAVSSLAPQLFCDLGADVTTIKANPNGVNINEECGSTHPETVREEVLKNKADVGLAFDGDADRLIAIDHLGNIVDGDYIMAVCGLEMQRKGRLENNTLVTTVMSNIGLIKALENEEVQVKQTAVGDRYVMETMVEQGLNFGGEQSGHIIFLEHNTTGDGMLTAIQLLDVIKESGKTLHDLSKVMKKYPQLLINTRVADKTKLFGNKRIEEIVSQVEKELEGDGRILIRPSGTEPIIRVMAEGLDKDELEKKVQRIVDVVQTELA